MKNEKLQLKIKNYKNLWWGLLVVLIVVLAFAGPQWFPQKNNNSDGSLIQTVSAKEIHPMFICPCCGKSIDAGCCGMANERKLYVDALTQGRLSKEEVIMAYVKKYGLDAFKDEIVKQEFKQKLIEQAPKQRAEIVISSDYYDFGNISQEQGVASTFFELKNNGNINLVINKLETSCGCTSASIVYQEQEGPVFAMPGHGINENIGDWQVSIAPGDTAQLKVYYDPDVHPNFRGTAIREIYVFSNDPIDFEVKATIELNQTP